jgi:hypothetical protein
MAVTGIAAASPFRKRRLVDIGDTFRHLRGYADAMAGVSQDGRASSVCGPSARRGKDGSAVARVRDPPQDRLQDLQPLLRQKVRGSMAQPVARSFGAIMYATISVAKPATSDAGVGYWELADVLLPLVGYVAQRARPVPGELCNAAARPPCQDRRLGNVLYFGWRQ